MRRPHAAVVPGVVAAGVLVLAAPAIAQTISRAVLALRGDPVYVDPAVTESIEPGDDTELRERIAASGEQIYVAVLGPGAAREAGGDGDDVVAALVQELDRTGTYAVVLGGELWAASTELGAGRAARLAAESARERRDDGVAPLLLDFVDRVDDELEEQRTGTTTSPVTTVSEPEADESGGLAAAVLWGVLGAALGIAGTLGVTTLSRRRRPPERPPIAPPPPVTAPPPPHQVPAAGQDDSAAREREALVTTLVDLLAHDLIRDASIRDRLRDTLSRAGVAEIRGDNEVFDPARHRAVGRVPTDDPALHNRVAATETLGYSDHGRVIRLPDVEVYQAGRDDAG